MAQRRSKRGKNGKRPLRRFLSLGLVVSMAAVAGTSYLLNQGVPDWNRIGVPDRTTTRWATVATDVLNVRAGPGTDTAVLTSMSEGDPVEVIGDAEAGFVPVAYAEGRAWLAERYLSYEGATRSLMVNPLPVEEVAAAEPPAEPEQSELDLVESEPVVLDEVPVEDPVAEPVPPPERWIDIDRSEATVTLYENGVSVASYSGRIGRDPSPDGYYSTAVGTYHVYSMTKGLAPTPFAEDTWLSDWVGFDPERKNGIHSPVRDAHGVEKEWQNPTTMGCVRLSAAAAVAVFDFAEIGMRVEVHE